MLLKGMTPTPDLERFQTGAEKYAAYLGTPEGRLRIDLAFANVEAFLPRRAGPLHALDLGGGTGAIAIRLARIGVQVTLLDASQPMLDLANRAARDAGVAERIVLKHGEATQSMALFEPASFDVVLCHNILEYINDPVDVLKGAARILRDASSIISVLVRNQAGEVFKAAIHDGDLVTAQQNLDAEWAHESLYGGRVRLFPARKLQTMLRESSFTEVAERGVRVLSDYLPMNISRQDEYERIFELERKVGERMEYVGVARYTQIFAQRARPVAPDVR